MENIKINAVTSAPKLAAEPVLNLSSVFSAEEQLCSPKLK
jgi:hypothetical protein